LIVTLHNFPTFLFIRWIVYAAVLIGAVWSILVFVRTARRRRDLDHLLTTTRLSIMDKEVQRACRFIEEAYVDAGLTPSLVAARQSTGEGFLEALFQRELGMSVTDFIAQVRVNRAKIILSRQDAAADTAILGPMVGMADGRVFEGTFHRLTGVSIADYARSITR
jgi:transcriptional regulator GlxA family with amidase domain